MSAARVVTLSEQVMIISANGIVERTPASGITRQGRSTQGVIMMRLASGDEVVAITSFEAEKDSEGKEGKQK